MFNVIFSLSLFCICFLCGVKFSSKYKKRKEFFSAILNFNRDMISSVSFKRDNLNTILQKEYESDYFNLILSKFKTVQTGDSKIDFPDFIKVEEACDIEHYFEKIGKSDADTQIKILNEYHEIFKSYYDLATKEDQSRGMLIKKMAVVTGIIAFIIAV